MPSELVIRKMAYIITANHGPDICSLLVVFAPESSNGRMSSNREIGFIGFRCQFCHLKNVVGQVDDLIKFYQMRLIFTSSWNSSYFLFYQI